MLCHLDGDLKDIYVNTTKTKPAHHGYEAVLNSLLMDDFSLGLPFENQLDTIKQKLNETSLTYLAQIRKIGNDLKGIKPAEEATIMKRMVTKFYYGMNDDTAKYMWGIKEANATSKNFDKMEEIIMKAARDQAVRATIQKNAAREGSALTANQATVNRRDGNRTQGGHNRNRNLGNVVPRKLFGSNIPFNLTQDDLCTTFARFSTLIDMSIRMRFGRPAGFPFVIFANPGNAVRAKKEKEGHDVWFRHVDNLVNIGNWTLGILLQSVLYIGKEGVYLLGLTWPGIASLGMGVPISKSLTLWHQRFMHAGVTTLK
jgi:hypothetical protein